MTLSTLQKRALLFWIGCIGTRSLVAWLAYAKPELLPYMGVVAAAIAIGFTTIYLGELRPTGAEVFGERIWWDSLRPVHATLYGAFAYFAFQSHPQAWTFLATDVLLGAGAWLTHHG
jgi:hypothetical protein